VHLFTVAITNLLACIIHKLVLSDCFSHANV
jgi:hypothetical protein